MLITRATGANLPPFGEIRITAVENGAEVLLVLNASPYHMNKQQSRYEVVRDRVLAGIVAWAMLGRAGTYRPGEAIAGITSELSRPVPDDHPRVTFTDVTQEILGSLQDASGRPARFAASSQT